MWSAHTLPTGASGGLARSEAGGTRRRIRPTMLFMLPAPLLLNSAALGQQAYVSRFDAYAGYAYLNSPKISLPEHGFQMQAGVRPRTWFSLGFDYSFTTGDLVLTPDLLTTSVQQQLGAQLARLAAAGQIPAGYQLVVPAHSRTQTFAAGPQLAYRHWSQITLFVRPSIGMIHEVATPRPTDPIAAGITAQLAPSGEKKDWAPFYGFGGGVDWIFSKHVSVRLQADYVRDHLFSDLLRDARNSVRFSVGPCFNFGRNIVR